jgi:chemotaxis-related protein WspB
LLVVLFQATQQIYGLPAAEVLEVIPRVSLRSVAGAPFWLAGLGSVRGQIVPIVDLAARLAERPTAVALSSRIALVRRRGPGSPLVGLLAERMTRTAQVSTQRAFRTLTLPHAPYLGEVFLEDGRMIQMIRPGDLLGEDIERLLFGAGLP